MPVPLIFPTLVDLKKGSNKNDWSFIGIPIPSSLIEIKIQSFCWFDRIVISFESWEYLQALLTKFVIAVLKIVLSK